ncbi:hypothetical protein [Clostridium puniceum]|nr:hypothetical protein [Clostridium puniceum]
MATNNMRIIVEKESANAEVLEERVDILGNSVVMLSDSLNKF